MEKKCKYKRSDAWLYVQNRMSREEEAEFQLHLLHCEACREELARFRQMVRSMGEKERRTISFRGWIMGGFNHLPDSRRWSILVSPDC